MKRTMKKVMALLLAAVMICSFAACGSQEPQSSTTKAAADESKEAVVTEAETKGDNEAASSSGETAHHTLRVGTSSQLDSMTPFATASSRGPADVALYEPLAILDKVGGELIGVIAKNWETIDDGTTWDVEIYDYIYDTKGNHITAEDVNFCCQGWIGKAAMAKCVACEVIDEFKVRITLANNGLGTLNAVMKGFPIVSQKEYEASADGMATAPVGTSPFVVTDYVPGGYLTLEKTDNYWQKDESLYGPYTRSNVDEITFVVIREAAQMTIALETGTVDAIDAISQGEISKYQEGGTYANDFTLQSTPDNKTYKIWFSGGKTRPVSDDLNLRIAIAYAINTDGLITGAMDGNATKVRTYGSPLFPDCPDELEDFIEFDPDKAREYLEKSNYAGQTIQIMTNNNGTMVKLAQIVEGCLEAVGIDAEVNSYDNALYQTYSRDPETHDLGISAGGASDYLVSAWYSNYTAHAHDEISTTNGWVDQELFDLMDEVMLEETHTQDRINKVQQIIFENMYSFPLFYAYIYNVWSNASGIVDVPAGCKGEAVWWCAEFAD